MLLTESILCKMAADREFDKLLTHGTSDFAVDQDYYGSRWTHQQQFFFACMVDNTPMVLPPLLLLVTFSLSDSLFRNIIIVLYNPEELFYDVQLSDDETWLGTLGETD